MVIAWAFVYTPEPGDVVIIVEPGLAISFSAGCGFSIFAVELYCPGGIEGMHTEMTEKTKKLIKKLEAELKIYELEI